MYGPYKWEISYRMTGMVKIKIKENGAISITIMTSLISSNNPNTLTGR